MSVSPEKNLNVIPLLYHFKNVMKYFNVNKAQQEAVIGLRIAFCIFFSILVRNKAYTLLKTHLI